MELTLEVRGAMLYSSLRKNIYINYLKFFCVEDLILPALYVFILSFMLIWAHIYYFVLFITQYYFNLLLRMFSFGL